MRPRLDRCTLLFLQLLLHLMLLLLKRRVVLVPGRLDDVVGTQCRCRRHLLLLADTSIAVLMLQGHLPEERLGLHMLLRKVTVDYGQARLTMLRDIRCRHVCRRLYHGRVSLTEHH